MSKIPSVDVLAAVRPENTGTGEEVLVYEGLAAAVEKYRPTNQVRGDRVWEAEAGSLNEVSKARQLASEYMIRTADKLNASPDRTHNLWADRFTAASGELYGQPDTEEATKLVVREYQQLEWLRRHPGINQRPIDLLMRVYSPIVESAPPDILRNSNEARERAAIAQYGKVITNRYQPLLDMVKQSGKRELTPDDLASLFGDAITWLGDHDDSAWRSWSVELKDGTAVSVSHKDEKVRVARDREPASLVEARGLVAHELLVHGLRAKNGKKTGDKKLASGLPEYLDAEEGLGILHETAVNGEVPVKAYDRFIDIALASGLLGGPQLSRQELFEITYARHMVRAALCGKTPDIETLEGEVQTHVDRLYRGGPGDERGERQAIFMKDVSYYAGYKLMAGYIAYQLDAGKTADQVFDYITQAKFDPTNQQHVERVAHPQKH